MKYMRIVYVQAIDVQASSVYVGVFWPSPHLIDGSALEDSDEDTGRAEGECDKVHGVDADARPTVDRECCIEEEERVLYGPVTDEIEHSRGHDQLHIVSRGLVAGEYIAHVP